MNLRLEALSIYFRLLMEDLKLPAEEAYQEAVKIMKEDLKKVVINLSTK